MLQDSWSNILFVNVAASFVLHSILSSSLDHDEIVHRLLPELTNIHEIVNKEK